MTESRIMQIGKGVRVLLASALFAHMISCSDREPFSPQHIKMGPVSKVWVEVETDTTARIMFSANNSEADFGGYALMQELYRHDPSTGTLRLVRDQDTLVQLLDFDGPFSGDTFFSQVRIYKDSTIYWSVCAIRKDYAVSERTEVWYRPRTLTRNIRVSWGWPREVRHALDVDDFLRPVSVLADTVLGASGASLIDTSVLDSNTISVHTTYYRRKSEAVTEAVDTVPLESSMYYLRKLYIDTVAGDTLNWYDRLVIDTLTSDTVSKDSAYNVVLAVYDTVGELSLSDTFAVDTALSDTVYLKIDALYLFNTYDTLWYVDTILMDSIARIHKVVSNDTVHFSAHENRTLGIALKGRVEIAVHDTVRSDLKIHWDRGAPSTARISGANGATVIYCGADTTVWFTRAEIQTARAALAAGSAGSVTIGSLRMFASDSVVSVNAAPVQPVSGDAFIVISGKFSDSDPHHIARVIVQDVEEDAVETVQMTAVVGGREMPAYVSTGTRAVIFEAYVPGRNAGNPAY